MMVVAMVTRKIQLKDTGKAFLHLLGASTELSCLDAHFTRHHMFHEEEMVQGSVDGLAWVSEITGRMTGRVHTTGATAGIQGGMVPVCIQ